jgi:hypothetical protein
MGMLIWLEARERVLRANAGFRLDDDSARVSRHLIAVSVRPDFDKDDQFPASITEHIKWRIKTEYHADTKYPVNRICSWYPYVENWMSGEKKIGDSFKVHMQSDNVLCTLPIGEIDMSVDEINMELDAGVRDLNKLAEVLSNVKAIGSIRPPSFSHEKVYPPAILYLITKSGELQWYYNELSSQPGGSKDWRDPETINNGWDDYVTAFNSGAAAMCTIQADGVLIWHGCDGYMDGSPRWRPAKRVGHGFQGFKSVFSGGEYVIYGIKHDGRVFWYRYIGAPTGGEDPDDWTGMIEVNRGWLDFRVVFSGGDGVIYAVRPDGGLVRTVHKGYLSGTSDWEAFVELDQGWDRYHHMVASVDGVIYAITNDGRVFWYRYGERKNMPSTEELSDTVGVIQAPEFDLDLVIGKEENPYVDMLDLDPGIHAVAALSADTGPSVETMPHADHDVILTVGPVWEGPVEIKHGLPNYRWIFAQLNDPIRFVG